MQLTDGPQLQGIALLNIPSTHGGTNMWGDTSVKTKQQRKKSKRLHHLDKDKVDLSGANQDIGDKLIEVVGLENCLHMGQVIFINYLSFYLVCKFAQHFLSRCEQVCDHRVKDLLNVPRL